MSTTARRHKTRGVGKPGAPRRGERNPRKGSQEATCPEVVVRWAKLPGSEADVRQTARDVAETVLGQAQRRLDAPRLNPVGELRGGAQTAEPLTYYVDGERIVGYQWNEGDDSLSLVTASGTLINGKTLARNENRSIFGSEMSAPKQRRPSRILVRPGRGGNPRRAASAAAAVDPTEGLEEYGEVIWESVGGGAAIAKLRLNAQGNSVIICRLSSEDENERITLQIEPCLALAKQFPEELRPRFAILAVNMPGTRRVRPEGAGPPASGKLEREDMLVLDEWMAEGWVEHVIARGADRIAREMLPWETLLDCWAGNDIGLWLARHGRRMDYKKDRLLMRCEAMVSAEERAYISDRCQNGLIHKGPLQGNGWLGTQPFGFYRDKATRKLRPDPEQWPFILRTFELADVGNCTDDNGLSYRRITEELAREGCPFDEERVRKILHDPIYATGEFSVRLRGIPVPQTPIELEQPVPLDRWLRVQTLLALRQGKTSRTPLGEFLFNYVEAVHTSCENERNHRDLRPLVKGYILPKGDEDLRRYRHAPFVPECCKRGGRGPNGATTWEREWLERPTILSLRELAKHPAVLRALAEADRHEIADTSARLTPAQRLALEHELDELQLQIEAASAQYAEDVAAGAGADPKVFEQMIGALNRKVEANEARLSADEFAASATDGASAQREKRVKTFLDIMTVEVPDDPQHRALRARLFQRIVHRIEIDDTGDGPITLTIYGHLVPKGASLYARDPVSASADLLDAYAVMRANGTPPAEAMLNKMREIETALPDRAEKAVSTLYPHLASLGTTQARMRLQQSTLAHEGWRFRPYDHRRPGGERAWRKVMLISPCS